MRVVKSVGGLLSRYCQQHGVEQALFITAGGIKGGKGVGQSQEIRAAIDLGSEQGPQGIGAARRLKKHGRVDAVKRSRAATSLQSLVGDLGLTASAATADARDRLFVVEEEIELDGAGFDAFELIGDGLCALFAKELLAAFEYRNQAHDALFRLDNAAFPRVEVDSQGLGKTTGNIEYQAETLGLSAGRFVFVSFVFRCILLGFS
jgi:hypothetical protein